ncbi:helix-turn-helix transcriptional regulator [Plasticicumulans sp.]|uniref:helix-turn-helix transcriptional regulator n=1 Tax=Plasticicumulans sp. TaxID=2307179 RepID=UPI00392856C0
MPTAPAPRILRRPAVTETYGIGRSTIYELAATGLLPRPVRLTARATGWPAAELEQVFAARVAGKTDDEIRALVQRLHAARQAEPASAA